MRERPPERQAAADTLQRQFEIEARTYRQRFERTCDGLVGAPTQRHRNLRAGLQIAEREEVARTVRRVVDKLLHAPSKALRSADAVEQSQLMDAAEKLFALPSEGLS